MEISSPQTEAELLARAEKFAGQTLGELAACYGFSLPKQLLHGKGRIGQLLEQCLGASAGTKSAPDFEQLHIELKTIPVSAAGKPQETTYVCAVPLSYEHHLTWKQSKVYQKLQKVLWLPVEANPTLAIEQRRVGTAILWRIDDDEATLQQDWEELMELVRFGQVEHITARHGTYLHIRPKAADSYVKTQGIGSQGELIATLPRGFYLRTQFTAKILKKYYCLK